MKKSHSNGTKTGVGYGQPPKQTRFKPGQSGNPTGRPRGSKSPRLLFQQIMNEKVTAREGDKVHVISKFEAIMRGLAAKAMKGDPKAFAIVTKLMNESGHFSEPPPSKLRIEFVRPKEEETSS